MGMLATTFLAMQLVMMELAMAALANATNFNINNNIKKKSHSIVDWKLWYEDSSIWKIIQVVYQI
jgi:hypothetical protein